MPTIKDCMTPSCEWISPETSIQEAAQKMKEQDFGFLPVGKDERLIGTVTDRDIVIRAIAENRDLNTPVRDIMSDRLYYCYEDQSSEEICSNMADLQIRRMPVVNRDKRLVGTVSFGDLAQSEDHKTVGKAESKITSGCGCNRQKAA